MLDDKGNEVYSGRGRFSAEIQQKIVDTNTIPALLDTWVDYDPTNEEHQATFKKAEQILSKATKKEYTSLNTDMGRSYYIVTNKKIPTVAWAWVAVDPNNDKHVASVVAAKKSVEHQALTQEAKVAARKLREADRKKKLMDTIAAAKALDESTEPETVTLAESDTEATVTAQAPAADAVTAESFASAS
jgi:Trk K+ transport system NAD-binding subunit